MYHRTARDAELNLQRPLDYQSLGPECCVAYANTSAIPSIDLQEFEQKCVLVRQIPENVAESDLLRLFGTCRLLKYCPARSVCFPPKPMVTKINAKVLWG